MLMIMSTMVYSEEVKESYKAKQARIAYEKQLKTANLLLIKAKVKYVKDLKAAIKVSAKKGDMKEAMRIQGIIDEIDIPKTPSKMGTSKIVLEDKHNGESGGSNVNNIYTLNVKKLRKTTKLEIDCNTARRGAGSGQVFLNGKKIKSWSREDTGKKITIDVSEHVIKEGEYKIELDYTGGSYHYEIHAVRFIMK